MIGIASPEGIGPIERTYAVYSAGADAVMEAVNEGRSGKRPWQEVYTLIARQPRDRAWHCETPPILFSRK